MSYSTQSKYGDEQNRLYEEDVPVHEWYRFVLSFPPHLIRDYVDKFSIAKDQCILDPFCGTGTTIVEAKKLGIPSVGLEANPVVHFAASVKSDWDVDPKDLKAYVESIATEAQAIFDTQGIGIGPLFRRSDAAPVELKTFNPDQERLVIKHSISPLPLHKALTIIELLEARKDNRFDRHAKLCLAKQVVYKISNLRFGPEIGVGKIKEDAPVASLWTQGIRDMALDLELVRQLPTTPAKVYLGDARNIQAMIHPKSIDAVITSPPYPNEKDYSRTTRLESVLLGFMADRTDLRSVKQQFIRSNTRSVYKDDDDDAWISAFPRIQELANLIEKRRIELQKTSGFEKLYGRVVLLYFGGMAKHLESLKPLLKPGAKLAYVVGDQASYFRIMIRTGQILAEIAEHLGYTVLGIDLFRTRFSTVTKNHQNEEVVLLQWDGNR
jgi:DNA modification methylase